MKIVFLGDSLTEGKPGVSYVDMLDDSFPNDTMINYGKGGDTVKSLLARLPKLPEINNADLIVLFVGTNDVFVKVSWTFSVYKKIAKQPWVKNRTEFKQNYNKLLERLKDSSHHILVVSPLMIGEQPDNEYNNILGTYADEINDLVASYEKMTYVNLRTKVFNKLSNLEQSDYIAKGLVQIMRDVKECDTTECIDTRSSERGLHFTLDGVHLNSAGAQLVHDSLKKHISSVKNSIK